MSANLKPSIRAFFDEATNTVSYLAVDPATHEAAVIDPVLDFDGRSGKISTSGADAVLAGERARNVHIHDGIGEEEFVRARRARGKTLALPLLLLPSIQVNIRAGCLPPAEANGRRYPRTPLTLTGETNAAL